MEMSPMVEMYQYKGVLVMKVKGRISVLLYDNGTQSKTFYYVGS